jgi:hypothetical protein
MSGIDALEVVDGKGKLVEHVEEFGWEWGVDGDGVLCGGVRECQGIRV